MDQKAEYTDNAAILANMGRVIDKRGDIGLTKELVSEMKVDF